MATDSVSQSAAAEVPPSVEVVLNDFNTHAKPVGLGTLGRVVAASIIGNVLEWFDFAVYGYMVPYLGAHFFPSDDKVASHLATFAVFAIGYFARPMGAVVLGRFGDRVGRRALLVLSIMILGLSSCAIGLLPTYDSIGIAAPILLVMLRLAQGFSVGGEYTGSMTYSTEVAPHNRRGFYSSFATLGCILGILASSAAVWATHATLGTETLSTWGWRIPFLLGLVVAIFGLWLRQCLPETIDTAEARDAEPIATVLRNYWKDLAKIIGIVTGANVTLYLVFVFAVDVAARRASGLPAEAINSIALVVTLPCIALGGWWSDIKGRRPVSIITNAIILVLGIPALSLCFNFELWPGGPQFAPATAFLTGQILMAIPMGLVFGVQGAMVAELLPKGVRCMVFSVAYSLAMALFAGSSPVIAEWLMNRQGWSLGPAAYMLIWVFIAIISVKCARETYRENL
jgi:MFS transporter, MHS family, proline/betaine transporter